MTTPNRHLLIESKELKHSKLHLNEPSTDEKKKRFHSFNESLNALFPGAIEQKKFHQAILELGRKNDLHEGSTLAMYSVCRDELTQPFVEELTTKWRYGFNISSLGGMVFWGKTGFQAGMAHAPKDAQGFERYLFFCGPHIAISEDGKVGDVLRVGRTKMSHACGALMAFQEELSEGKVLVKDDPQDLEQSLLKQYLFEYIKYGEVPSLVDMTYRAHHCISDMVDHTLEGSVNKPTCRYMIVCIILIHGPNGSNYVWTGPLHVVNKGISIDLKAQFNEIVKTLV